jgi:hypothetical protein
MGETTIRFFNSTPLILNGLNNNGIMTQFSPKLGDLKGKLSVSGFTDFDAWELLEPVEERPLSGNGGVTRIISSISEIVGLFPGNCPLPRPLSGNGEG